MLANEVIQINKPKPKEKEKMGLQTLSFWKAYWMTMRPYLLFISGAAGTFSGLRPKRVDSRVWPML